MTSIRFIPPLRSKSYAPFWQADYAQLMHIADECLHWDGNQDEHCFYTRDKQSADFIQYAFTACGYRAVLREDKHYRDHQIDYRVFRHNNTMVGMTGSPKSEITKVPSQDGKQYCFTVPSGFWVMRRGGNIVMTGNCGMMAVRTQFEKEDVEQAVHDGHPLSDLREAIEHAVPL